jgi:deoxyribose-phosphate aldolase
MDLAKWIDHTLLRPDATAAGIETLCAEASALGFASVCVNPHYVPLAKSLHPPAVCTVIGFPLGANNTGTKCFEAELALSQGADELDMVLNIGALKSGNSSLAAQDIAAVAAIVRQADKLLKVILETCLLTDAEKELACLLSVDAGAHFVKTSTGFSSGGATTADIALMRRAVGPNTGSKAIGVKASGGIRSYSDAIAMIDAGATRLGTSAGVAIVSGAPAATGAY